MLDKIKSSYFSMIIFSLISEKRKLQLIKYNKRIQNIENITLLNYKILSRKYIVQETKGNIKIFNALNDILIFEGDYFNGIGKEYNPLGSIIYEGSYLNGKRNGKGTIYYIDGKILFKGEFLKVKKWNVKEYDKNGNIIYELKEGIGFIKEYNMNYNIIFEGEYLNGERNGKGKEYYYYEIKYEGEYLNGRKTWKRKRIL